MSKIFYFLQKFLIFFDFFYFFLIAFKMKITNELLAAYAEGNVTKEERNAVRQHLAQNPKELESVMMMDEFYDLNIDQEKKCKVMVR